MFEIILCNPIPELSQYKFLSSCSNWHFLSLKDVIVVKLSWGSGTVGVLRYSCGRGRMHGCYNRAPNGKVRD